MFSVVVLAAGNSYRMKKSKALLKFDKNTSFIEQIKKQYLKNPLCIELIIVLNKNNYDLLKENILNDKRVKIVLNKFPEKERFYSVYCGLKALHYKKKVFLHNVDNPFVNQYLIKTLLQDKNNAQVIIPQYENKGGHPVLINENVVLDICKEKKFGYRLNEYFSKYNKVYIPVKDKNILVNINTQEDYKRLIKI